jgi:hypothetical protein
MRIRLALALMLLPVMVYSQEQLPPAVVIGKNAKEKFLVRPGAKVMGNGALGAFLLRSEQDFEREIGSYTQVKKPFLVKDVSLSIHENTIPGCVAAINIYQIGGKKEPLFFNVAVSDKPKDYHIRPEKPLVLEPGNYFIAFQIAECDKEALKEFLAKPEKERGYDEMALYFVLHFKNSHGRDTPLDKMEYCPFNMGLAVKGLEYKNPQ